MADERDIPSQRPRPRRPILLLALALTVASAVVVIRAVDTAALGRAAEALVGDPLGAGMAVAAFALAFGLRAVAWSRVLPDLHLGHAWAGLHVTLAGNHVLPLRLGEPLRVVSVVRRASISWRRAAASTVTLRAADTAAVAGIGLVTGISQLDRGGLGAVVVAVGAMAVAAAGAVWLARLRRSGEARLPGPIALGATVVAWALEAVVVWQAAAWAGIALSPSEAMLVTAAAVVAQVAAFAPGGFGTYEAGGTAAFVLLGYDPGTALAAVLTAHAVKTAYSLVVGGAAFLVPAPPMVGRIRLPRVEPRADAAGDTALGPVVLFLPAHDEEESVGNVVARAPSEVRGHRVQCVVIDDGSTDDTAARARAAGAEVVSLGENRGLGAAVRVGLAEALGRDPAAVAFCDADGEYAPEELERLVAPILEGRADYVVGSRFAGDIRRMLPHRRLGNRVLTLALSWVARRRISDGQSGYRAFSPEAAAAAEVIHDFNYAQVLTLDLLAKGFRYAEVPISYGFRTTGRSFVRLGRYLRRVVPAVYRELNAA